MSLLREGVPLLEQVLEKNKGKVKLSFKAHTDDAYRAAYVDGLRNLLDAIAHWTAPPRRIVFTSSTAVYAQNDGGWVDEDSPTEPDSFPGRRLLEAEQLLAAAQYETVAVRLGGIYGPGRTGLIDRVRRGEARRERNRVRWLNLIHRDDIVGSLIHLMRLDNPAHTFIGVDNLPQDYNALVEWLADRSRRPAASLLRRTTNPRPRGA